MDKSEISIVCINQSEESSYLMFHVGFTDLVNCWILVNFNSVTEGQSQQTSLTELKMSCSRSQSVTADNQSEISIARINQSETNIYLCRQLYVLRSQILTVLSVAEVAM